MFNPKYQLNNKILSDLTAIAEAKGIIDRVKILPRQELRLRRQAMIRMTHHSTEIEGNRLNMRQVEALYAKKKIDAPDRDILEDYYNTNRPAYYEAINLGKTYDERKTDITSWLEYFVKGFKKEIDEVKNKILPLFTRNVDGKIKSQIYLTPEQLKIIDFLDQVGRISVKDVEDVLSCPKRTAQLQLQKLKKTKMIKVVGKGKSTSYIANT